MAGADHQLGLHPVQVRARVAHDAVATVGEGAISERREMEWARTAGDTGSRDIAWMKGLPGVMPVRLPGRQREMSKLNASALPANASTLAAATAPGSLTSRPMRRATENSVR